MPAYGYSAGDPRLVSLAELEAGPEEWAQNMARTARETLERLAATGDHVPGFADQPDDYRLAARHIVDDHGGEVAGYCDGFLQVALPADDTAHRAMVAALEAIGLVGEPRWTYFPLGSDNPPASLRHFGPGTAAAPRGDRPGYWKYRNFYVKG